MLKNFTHPPRLLHEVSTDNQPIELPRIRLTRC